MFKLNVGWAIQLSLTSAIPANLKKLKRIINFKAYTIFNNLNRNFDQGFLNFYTALNIFRGRQV